MNLRLLPFAFLILPLAEIAGFVLVGRQIGVLATLGLVIAGAVVGLLLVRSQGMSMFERFRRESEAGAVPGHEIADGMIVMLAGVLLIIPGFITDLVALLLFLPPVRAFALRRMAGRMKVRASRFGTARQSPRQRDAAPTIDLDEDDFSRGPNRDSPWRKNF